MVVFEMAQRLLPMQERMILQDTAVPKRYASLPPGEPWLATARQSQAHHERFGQRERDLLCLEIEFAPKGFASHSDFGRDAAHMLLANNMLGKKCRPEFICGG
jgi:hypothetical protein